MSGKKKVKRYLYQKNNKMKLVLPLYAAGILAMIFFGVYLARGSVNQPEQSLSSPITNDSTNTPPPDVDSRSLELTNMLYSQTRNTIGDPSAPVTIIEFSDFQ